MYLLGRYPGGGGVFGRNDAVVLIPAVFAGAEAPADFAGTDVPAVADKELSAVAKGCSLANDAEGSPLVIRVDKQLRAVVENNVTVPEPIEHSVDERPSEEGSSPVDIVTVPEPIEHSDVREAAAPPSTGQSTEHSEDSGDWQSGRQSHADDSDTQLALEPGDRSPTGCWGGIVLGDCVGCRCFGGSLVPYG